MLLITCFNFLVTLVASSRSAMSVTSGLYQRNAITIRQSSNKYLNETLRSQSLPRAPTRVRVDP